MGRMLSTFASVVAESGHHNPLPAPAWLYGVFALLIFAMMLGVLFAFRQAATKLPAAHNTVAHDDHGHDAGDHH